MADHPFPPPPRVELAITGSALAFPVRRVHCVGRNYAEHAREMGHDPDREPPFFFAKNLDPSGEFPYPSGSTDVHHEVELAVALGSGGAGIPETDALARVYGHAGTLAGVGPVAKGDRPEARIAGLAPLAVRFV
jgi:fumarylpyruvate hydrolase